MFRILQTGLNSNDNHYLSLSGFEIYGLLFPLMHTLHVIYSHVCMFCICSGLATTHQDLRLEISEILSKNTRILIANPPLSSFSKPLFPFTPDAAKKKKSLVSNNSNFTPAPQKRFSFSLGSRSSAGSAEPSNNNNSEDTPLRMPKYASFLPRKRYISRGVTN